MLIKDHMRLRDIQIGFNQLFPYLKLEFYKGEHHAGEGSPKRTQLDPEQSLAKVRTVHTEGEFKLAADLKVAQLEAAFLEKYGLNAQVFRKSGNLWMQTTATDSWTLAEQNRKGGSSEKQYASKYGQ